jgi:hypothetical protein
MNRVFISHPYRNAPLANAEHVVNIARTLARSGQLPIAPQIYLPQFISEATERDLALRMCLALVGLSDGVRVFGEPTEGMRLEIAEAHRLGIPVLDGEIRRALPKREPPR